MSEELVKYEEEHSVAVLDATGAIAQVDNATLIARKLADIIEEQKVYTVIGRKRHVHVEGWTTLAAMAGYIPEEVRSEENEDGSWESYVRLIRIRDGKPLGGASMICGGPSEREWKNRPPYAVKSMATTRATGKACRLAFSWIMVLAGYSATPAEEMLSEAKTSARKRPSKASPSQEEKLEAQLKQNFLNGLACPVCGEEGMARKQSKTGNVFFGCRTWKDTRCKGAYNVDEVTELWEAWKMQDLHDVESDDIPGLEPLEPDEITSEQLNWG